MSSVLLTKRIEFAAAHRYMKAEWDEVKNRAVFGPCYNPPAHGHNYMIEVTGFASADGSTAKNKALSDRRAEAVKDYLIEQHKIPLRRLTTSYGFGELEPIADNKTREGRAQNRRVEVKILVNKGLTQPAPTMSRPGTSGQ